MFQVNVHRQATAIFNEFFYYAAMLQSMVDADHHVIFSFRLPPVLLLHVEPGVWPRSPRGCAVVVAPDGLVTITSVDHLQSYACDQVLRLARQFLAASVKYPPLTSIDAELSAPYCRDRPVQFKISLGAKVSIAQTSTTPLLAASEAPGPKPFGRRGLRLAAG
jgi:hypothetical protein